MTSSNSLLKLEGHTDWVLSVAISPDGTTVVSGSSDKTVRVWDMKTGKELLKLEGHTDWVRSVAISPDGTTLVSGSSDKTVRVWDGKTGKELMRLEGHTGTVSSVAISSDGTTLVSGSDDKTVRVWDMKTGKELLKLEGHTSLVNSVAISPDGTRLVSGSTDRTVRTWDGKTGKELLKLERHTSLVNSVAISPDGTRLVSGNGDNTVRVWDMKTGKELLKLEVHTGSVQSVAISPDGTRLVSGTDKTVRTWASGLPLPTSTPGLNAPVSKSPAAPNHTLPSSTTTTAGGHPTPASPAAGQETAPSRSVRHAVDHLPPVYLPIADFTKNFSPTTSCGEYLLVDAAQCFGDLVPQLGEIVQECGEITQSKLESGSAPPELEPSQLFACVCYTFDTALLGVKRPEENFFYQLNKLLQTRDMAKLDHLQGYLYYLMGGLKALPSHKGVVYRGLDAAGFEVVKQHYSKTVKIHWSGLSSTSEDLAFASAMAGPEGVVLKIEVYTDAKKISQASALPKEAEVLLLPNFSAIVFSEVYVDSSTGMRMCDLVEVKKEKKTHTF